MTGAAVDTTKWLWCELGSIEIKAEIEIFKQYQQFFQRGFTTGNSARNSGSAFDLFWTLLSFTTVFTNKDGFERH